MLSHATQPPRNNPGGSSPQISPHGEESPPVDSFPMPSQEIIGELMAIAQRIGGDFRMSVKIGAPGAGSYFDNVSCSITLDPIHIAHSPLLAKFVAGHEGSHRAITLSLTQIGMTEEEARFYLSHIGFHAGFNGCEDNAVNTWMVKVFPGMDGPVKAAYNEMFCRPNVEVQLPAIEIARQKLGRYPRFGHYISEVIRDWHTGQFSPTLDPEVQKALRRTIKAARRYTAEIPGQHATYSERIESMQRRMEIYRHDIWPEVQKLVELDLQNEQEHQLLKEILTKRLELKRLKKERDGIHHDRNPTETKRRKDRIEQLEKELEGVERQCPELFELDEEMEELLREAIEKLAKQLEELHKKHDETVEKILALEEEIQALHEELGQAKSQEERKKIVEQIEAMQRALQEAREELYKLEQLLQALSNPGGGGGAGGMTIDMSKLKPETQKALSKLLSKLSPTAQGGLRERAEQALKDFDDGVSDELKGKLNKSNKNHAEREQQENSRHYHWRHRFRDLREHLEHFEIKREQLRRNNQDYTRNGVSAWDRALLLVGDLVNPLYLRLKRFFRPQADPAWEPDYPSGGRLNLDRVMQGEADPRMLDRLWERRGVPRTFDYRFSFLVDISGSMQGAKAEETFKALVILAEVLERLHIPYEIGCFGSYFCNLKAFREKLTDPNRLFTAQCLLSDGGGTMDAFAIRCAYQRILKDPGKDNFLIVMTDGQSGMPGELQQIVSEIRAGQKVKLMGLGLGPGTDFVRSSYPHGVANISMRISQGDRDAGELEFIDVITIIVEDMLRNPDRYSL